MSYVSERVQGINIIPKYITPEILKGRELIEDVHDFLQLEAHCFDDSCEFSSGSRKFASEESFE